MKSREWFGGLVVALPIVVLSVAPVGCGGGGGRMSTKGSEVQYAEGDVAGDANRATVDGKGLPDFAEGLNTVLASYRGLRIGVEYNDQSVKVVSPIEDEWERLSATVEGFKSRSRDHLPLPQPGVTAERLGNLADMHALDASVADVDSRYKALSSVPAPDRARALNEIVNSLKNTVNTGLRVADAPDATDNQRAAALTLVNSARDQYLGTLQNYEGSVERPARFYRNVTAQLDSTVGVKLRNTSVEGTGFLLSDAWVITANHVVAKVTDLANIKVVIRYEDDESGATTGGTSCEVTEVKSAKPQDGLDVAALKFRCPPNTMPPTAKPLRLSNRNPSLDEPVYVVGHPKQSPKRVADNAFIRYPYRMSISTLTIVQNRAARDPSETTALKLAYTPCDPGFWCYKSAPDRWDAGTESTPIWPTMGFAANTYKGNSGSPLFFADDHSVAGLVFGGRRDSEVVGDFSFFRHEGAIPSPVLMAWLKSNNVPFTEE